MRFTFITCALALVTTATVASAQPAPAAAAAHYSTSTTPMGDLLDDPVAKAVLAKYLPEVVSNPQIDMARGMTLKDTQQYAPDMVSNAALTKIDADLAKLPAKK